LEGLTRPLALQANDNGFVSGIKCERMDFADPDSTGKWQIIPVPDSEFVFEADTVIMAMGNEPNTSFLKNCLDLRINENGTIWVDEETGMTSITGVFAAGGAVTGGDSLLDAMVSGKMAAKCIDQYFTQNLNPPALAGVKGGNER